MFRLPTKKFLELSMGIGKLFLTSISSGIITQSELNWIVKNQLSFSRCEQATALKLGQLLDSGKLSLGCRIWFFFNYSLFHNHFYFVMTPEAEKFNGWLAMIGFVAAFGAYATTGQIIPGIF